MISVSFHNRARYSEYRDVRTKMLEYKGVNKTFDGRPALIDINLSIPEGATHALIGSSGSGKTTLLRVTLGLIPFDRGYVKIGGHELLSFSPPDWADRIGYVPQDGGLFPHFTGRQNVSLVARIRGWNASRTEHRVKELEALVGLESDVLDRFPHEMSGGQKQRVSIMRAAIMNPAVMLLDEPMGALDPLTRYGLQQELKAIFQSLGKTVLLVTHDLSEAAFFAEQITLLHNGQIVQTGSYRNLLSRPANSFVTLFINAQRTLPDAEALQ
jgi:osmoprotectant transport system ATP-binding protein